MKRQGEKRTYIVQNTKRTIPKFFNYLTARIDILIIKYLK